MIPDKTPERSLHVPQPNELRQWFFSSGLQFVISVFSIIAILNVVTLIIGTQRIYSAFDSNPYTAFLSFVIYDSPGTIAGLLGVVAIFAVLSLFSFLLTGRASKIRSGFFVLISLVVGVASQVVWNSCCNEGGTFPAGSSAIDFAALACLIVYSLRDSIRFLSLDSERKSRLWVDSRLTAFYFILVAAMLILYAFSIQPIDVPTIRYNWRVHEYAFLSAAVVSAATEILRLR